MSKIGYMRVSTNKQDHAIQHEALIKSGVLPTDIYADTISGKARVRPGLTALLGRLSRNDTVVVFALDRLGRSVRDLKDITEEIQSTGASIVFLREAIDTSTPVGRLFFHILASIAEFEREIICQRVQAGVDAAIATRTKPWGRLPASPYNPADILALRQQGLSQLAIATRLGISRATVKKHLP